VLSVATFGATGVRSSFPAVTTCVEADAFNPRAGARLASSSALVHAVTATKEITGREAKVIGRLAVVCRMGTPHRVTTELGIVNRRGVTEQKQLELLIAGTRRANGPSGAFVRTPVGDVQVDVRSGWLGGVSQAADKATCSLL
jgi:hypothetical protein